MWSEWQMGDEVMAAKILGVMHNVDRAYASLGIHWLTVLVFEKQAHVFFYEHEGTHIVLIIYYVRKMKLHRVYTAGYSGNAAPREACFLGMDKLVDFMRERNLRTVYTIRRNGLDLALANEVFDCVPSYPNIDVEVKHEMHDRVAWYLTLNKDAAVCR